MVVAMTRITQMTVLALVALVVAAPMAAAAPSPGTAAMMFNQETETPTPDGNASVAPGEKLSGVIGVQQAELEGEVAERTFGVKVAQANTDRAKAEVVKSTLGDVEERVAELEDRKETLDEARANGSISEGEYRAQIAVLAVELQNTQRLLNGSERTAEQLPAELLSELGINVEAIQTLKNSAENLSGPEVAEIAQSIAGEDVGRSVAGEQSPVDVGEQIPDRPEQGDDRNGTEDSQQDGDDGSTATPEPTPTPGGDQGTDAGGGNQP